MSLDKELVERSGGKCELCGGGDAHQVYLIPPREEMEPENCLWVCDTCFAQVHGEEEMDANHWRFLNESIWSESEGVKVVSYRMLHRMRAEGWPEELLDMIYLEEDSLAWAEAGLDEAGEPGIRHLDSNGALLEGGDTVVLIKDLNVKGANFTAKRGTAVRNISLVQDNPEQIEGRVNGQHIVILTKFVKKS